MSDEKDERIVEAILAGGVKIPPMPTVLLECETLSRDDDAGPQEFAGLIGKDAGLAGALFRVAGSPVFGLRAKAETLEKAITVLGLKTTLAVIRGEALRNALSDPEQIAVMNALWQRMNHIAELIVAAHKSLRVKGVTQDQALMLGIFHDCGVAILCRRYPTYVHAFAQSPGWPDLAALDQAHQSHHAVAGQMVARNWQLPPDLVLAIRHHHDTRLAGLPENVVKLIILLQFAMHLYNRKTNGDDSEWDTWRPQVLELLAMDEVALAEAETELLGG